MIRTRKKAWLALAVATLGCLTLAVAPAAADVGDDAKSGDACWVDLDTGSAPQCFDDEADLADAVLEQTGAIIVREGSQIAARGGAALATLYPVLDIYTGSNYTGTFTTYLSSSSTVCSGAGTKVGNIGGAANNTTSSWHAYYGCAARVYDLTGQAGDQYGSYVNASTVGSGMDNRASSYRLT